MLYPRCHKMGQYPTEKGWGQTHGDCETPRSVVARAFQDGSQQHHPAGVPAAGAGVRTSGALRTPPCPPSQAWGPRARRWSKAGAAVLVHGEFPWQVLSCHLAQVIEVWVFLFSCVHRGRCCQSSRGSDLPWDVVWADIALCREVSSHLCRPCLALCG